MICTRGAARLFLLLIVSVVAGCHISQEQSIGLVGCLPDITPFLTHYKPSVTWGPDHSACLRLEARDAESVRTIERSCLLTKSKKLVPTTYPAHIRSAREPEWWDVKEGDAADYAKLLRFEGDWEGYVYRLPPSKHRAYRVYLMCAFTL